LVADGEAGLEQTFLIFGFSRGIEDDAAPNVEDRFAAIE
jgi:hypothetical protein